MKELVFTPKKPIGEIEADFENFDFFSTLVEGLEESLDCAKRKPRTETILRKRSLPSIDVPALRRSLDMTQRDFACMLGVSCRTVESWEIGRTNPNPTAKKLMFLIQEDSLLVNKLSQHSEALK